MLKMFGDTLSPKESAAFIAKHATLITIKDDGIEKLAKEIVYNFKSGKIGIAAYGDDGLHPSSNAKNLVDWMFLIDVLNFCFWTPGDATKWKVDGQTGYMALCAAISRAVKEGVDITNPKYYSLVTEDELSHIFKSDDCTTPIPLLSLRVKCLHEVGKVLNEKYRGTFENCIKEANKSAVELLKIIVNNFPCFKDEAVFNGKRVSFYKRAQIAVADLWSRFLGQGLGEFHDIDNLTMFADYRVPQVLVYYGAMEYKPELMKLLKQDDIMENGSKEEIEIRGCTIHVVELVTEVARKIIQAEECNPDSMPINAVLIDFFLWMYRRDHAAELEHIPFHKVYSCFY